MTSKDSGDIENASVGAETKEEEKGPRHRSHISKVFDKFDSNKNGNIDADNFALAIKSMGQELTKEQINDLIEEIDANGDGQIDFDEFKVLFAQSRFINQHERELIRNMTRMVKTVTRMDPLFLKERGEIRNFKKILQIILVVLLIYVLVHQLIIGDCSLDGNSTSHVKT